MKINDLIPSILIHAPNCGTPLALLSVRKALRQFCKDSKAYRHTFEYQTVVRNMRRVELDPPTDTQINEIHFVKLDGRKLDPITKRLEEGRTVERANTPTHFRLDGDYNLVLTPVPDKNYVAKLEVEVSLFPAMAATFIADKFIERYAEIIEAGALSYILGVNGKEFYNPRDAAKYAVIFQQGIEKAEADAQGEGKGEIIFTEYGGY